MTNFTPTANPTAKAVAKHVRVTPMKARRVVDLVRGRSVEDALNILKFAPQAASEPVAKVIASAAANAENNLDLDPSTLIVATAFVDEGTTLKRFQPRAQGRAFRIRKRTSHITVIVESRPPRDQGAAQSARSRRAQGSKAAAGTGPAPAKAPTKKAPAKKAPANKASAKKAPAKKVPATRAGATKTAEASDEAKGGSQ